MFLMTACANEPIASKNVDSASNSNQFVIKGIAEGFPDQKVTLVLLNGRSRTHINSIEASLEGKPKDEKPFMTTDIINGQFEFKGQLDEPVMDATLSFGDSRFSLFDRIVLEPSNMQITLTPREPSLDLKNIPEDTKFIMLWPYVEGSSSHNLAMKYFEKKQKWVMETNEIFHVAHVAGGEPTGKDRQLIDKIMKKVYDENIAVIKKNPSKLESLFAGENLLMRKEMLPPGINFDEITLLFESLSKEFQNAQIGNHFKEEHAFYSKLASRSTASQFAKDFTLNDIDNNPVKLSSELKKNKYILLEFWASWCAPCRAENPNILAAYKKYHDKGFNVLAVSLDGEDEKDDWLQAIKDDGMPWIHVNGLKGQDVADEYGVSGVPANFLIDSQGMIVATHLRGKALHEKLAELLD